MTSPLILIYNIDPEKTSKLGAVCARQGIELRAVKPFEYMRPIGALAGIPVAESPAFAPGGAFSDEMLVMCHMLSYQLDAFLAGMREAGLPRVALKAVLTPANVTWSSLKLRDELAREHQALAGR